MNKQMKNELKKIKLSFMALAETQKKMASSYLTITQAKRRDYLVRTKYLGKLKNPGIIKDYKKQIEALTEDSFDSFKNNILNYRLNDLDRAYNILINFEDRQLIADKYN